MPQGPRRFPLLLLALLLLPALSACREEPGAPEAEAPPVPAADAAAEDAAEARELALAHAEMIESDRLSALQVARDCGIPEDGYLVLQFEGLADLASEQPGATTTTSQDHVMAILPDATDPTQLKVKGKEKIVRHAPYLWFSKALNPTLWETYKVTSTQGRVPLNNTVIKVGELANEAQVEMQRQSIGTSPIPADQCSLHWLPLIDDLAPGHDLYSGVFTASPLHRSVTTHVTIEEGVAFAGRFYVHKSDPAVKCLVRFPGKEPRALAKSFSVAVPADANGQVTLTANDTPWVFTLAGGKTDMVRIENHPTKNQLGDDFAAHLALRQGMEDPMVNVPLPSFYNCTAGAPPGNNPQCSPADNHYP